MKIKTSSFVEHQSSGQQEVFSPWAVGIQMLVPGASSCCEGCSSSSCCSWG